MNHEQLAMRHFLPTALRVLDRKGPRRYLRKRETDPVLRNTTTVSIPSPLLFVMYRVLTNIIIMYVHLVLCLLK